MFDNFPKIGSTTRFGAGSYNFYMLDDETRELYAMGFIKRKGKLWMVSFVWGYYPGMGYAQENIVEGFKCIDWRLYDTKKEAMQSLTDNFNCDFTR